MRRFARRLPGSRILTTPALSLVLIMLASTALAGALYSGVKLLAGDTEPIALMALDRRATEVVTAEARRDVQIMAAVPQTPVVAEPIAPAPAAAAAAAPVPARDTVTPAAPAAEVMSFDGRPLRKVKTLTMKVTAYSPDERSCGKWADGFTASGYSVWTNGMKLVAADTRVLPFGTIITVPGYNHGKPVPVLDRGGAIKGHRLDVLYPTHEVALGWGVQTLSVDVWEYADE